MHTILQEDLTVLLAPDFSDTISTEVSSQIYIYTFTESAVYKSRCLPSHYFFCNDFLRFKFFFPLNQPAVDQRTVDQPTVNQSTVDNGGVSRVLAMAAGR